MIISSYKITPYSLPFIQPWKTASGIWTKRKGWLVQIEANNGLCGFGDCSPLPEAGTESFEAAREQITKRLPCLQGLSPEKALEQLPENDTPAARFAIETSLLDLICKANGEPLHNWLVADSPNNLQVNSSIGTLNNETTRKARASASTLLMLNCRHYRPLVVHYQKGFSFVWMPTGHGASRMPSIF